MTGQPHVGTARVHRSATENQRLTVARARLEAIELQEAAENAETAAAEAQRLERERTMEEARAEVRAAELEQKVADLEVALSAAGADVQARMVRLRAAFDALAAELPGAVTAWSLFRGRCQRAADLRAKHGLTIDLPTVVPTLNHQVMLLLDRVIRAQGEADSR